MEALKLTDTEQQFFGELFCACDVDNIGKISGVKAHDLFLGAQLPVDTIGQITDLCGAKRLGHFGRSQFYVALKLIAAAQAGLPLKPDSFNSGTEIPLPKFVRLNDSDKKWQQQQVIQSSQMPGEPDLIKLQENAKQSAKSQAPPHLPPPPAKAGSRNSMNQRPTGMISDVEASQNNQATHITGGSQGNSPLELPSKGGTMVIAEPTSPTATNNVSQNCTDKAWAAFQNAGEGPEGPKLWDHFDEDRQLLGTEEESSDRHSSDDEYDIWSITDEQREYYTNQFKSMQSDLSGLLSGTIAKDFFEKSKLPVQELSRIWQLSDVNKNGALSLEEFCTAMHLVVLRRNNIELPKVLPLPLIPRIAKQQSENDGHSVAVQQNVESPTEALSPHAKEWTRFNDSPTSSLSSPGIKPVNFDFQKSAVEQDPKIFHPVPLRISPDSQVSSTDGKEAAGDPTSYEPVAEQKSPSKKLVASESQEFKNMLPQSAIQRPIPKKPAVPGPGAIPPPPHMSSNNVPAGIDDVDSVPVAGSFPVSASTGSFVGQSIPQGPKKEPPPPPPPRPKKNHARSCSLDLNRLGTPPAVPPRISPSTAGAFEIYRRPEAIAKQGSKAFVLPSSVLPSDIKNSEALPKDGIYANSEKQKEEPVTGDRKISSGSLKSPTKVSERHLLRSAVRSQRDYNSLLSRLNSELNQELSEVMEERIALEIQLEHLKPFST